MADQCEAMGEEEKLFSNVFLVLAAWIACDGLRLPSNFMTRLGQVADEIGVSTLSLKRIFRDVSSFVVNRAFSEVAPCPPKATIDNQDEDMLLYLGYLRWLRGEESSIPAAKISRDVALSIRDVEIILARSDSFYGAVRVQRGRQ